MLAATPLTLGANATWERLPPLPMPNGGFVASANQGRIVVVGGVTWQGDTKIWLDRIWTYDPERNAWSETGRLPAPVAYSVFGDNGSTLWFAGGSSGDATHRTLWRMDAGRPPQVVAALKQGFVNAAGGLIGHLLYVAGGTDDQARTDRITNAFRGIDVRTGEIMPLPDYPEPNLTTGTAAVAGGRLFFFGGARWDNPTRTVVNFASAHVFSPATNRWDCLPPLPHPGRGLAAITLDERHILVAGGYRNDDVEFVGDAFVFATDARTYTPTTPLPYAAMVTLVKNGEWLYCLGGEDRKRHRSAAAFRIRWASLLSKPAK